LEHIGNETINNIITKRVVCLNVVKNEQHQNDQVFTQGLPTFWGAEYNESNDSLNVNEDNVENSFNLEDL
jgi:hypothetical protein